MSERYGKTAMLDEIERLRSALRHIADHYDAETSACVPSNPERVGTSGPHEWVELSRWIEEVLSGGNRS